MQQMASGLTRLVETVLDRRSSASASETKVTTSASSKASLLICRLIRFAFGALKLGMFQAEIFAVVCPNSLIVYVL